MKLGLFNDRRPFKDSRGVWRIDGMDLHVVDPDTGDRLEGIKGMLWCDGSLLIHRLEGEDGGLLTPEHVQAGKSYLVVVVECEGAFGPDRRVAKMRD